MPSRNTSVALPEDVVQILRARKNRTGIPVKTQLIQMVCGLGRDKPSEVVGDAGLA